MIEGQGKWMIRKYVSGSVIEKSKFWVPEQTKRRRPKKASSSFRKRDENEREAIKELSRLVNCNFTHGDLWLSIGYSEKGFKALCETVSADGTESLDEIKKAADKELELFLRRMRREAKKLGVEFKYIAITSDTDGKSGEIVRPHHHVIMPRASYELCIKHWKYGNVDYQILRDQEDYTPLAVYLCKQVRRADNENRWKASRNLKRPIVSEEETHSKGILRAPAGARVIDMGHYDEESGNHYIRYIPKPKAEKRGGQRCGAGTKANIDSGGANS